MHEVQIEKLKWLLRDLGVEADFTQEVSWQEECNGEVQGLFLTGPEADRLIDVLRLAASVAA